jgi:Predicted O-methyltransferase
MYPVYLDKARLINGWMTDREMTFLAERARESKVVIEVGSYLGRSTRAMADNSKKDTKIYCVDPWKGSVVNDDGIVAFDVDSSTRAGFYNNLAGYVNAGRVIMCEYRFSEWPGILTPKQYDCDFLFIDGDHRYPNVIEDINIALTFQPRILAGHDYSCQYWPGVKKAVDELFGGKAQIEDTIWWIQLS